MLRVKRHAPRYFAHLVSYTRAPRRSIWLAIYAPNTGPFHFIWNVSLKSSFALHKGHLRRMKSKRKIPRRTAKNPDHLRLVF
jgi:hypothetical protein